MPFYAHTNPPYPPQPLVDHLTAVADLAEHFSIAFSGGEWARIGGLLHDIGKYQEKFQRKLEGAQVLVEHAGAGARAAVETYGLPGRILASAIMGHHGGLPDGGTAADSADDVTLLGRLKRVPDEHSAWKNEIRLPTALTPFAARSESDTKTGIAAYLYLFTKLLHSCLVDADYLDTERYMDPSISLLRAAVPDFDEVYRRFSITRQQFTASRQDNPINRIRSDVLHRCLDAAKGDRGFYRLTVPTGGGKTFTSLSFALDHAMHNDLERVIYAIPFTSIIDQCSRLFREWLGDDAVLEHHSNIVRETRLDEKEDDRSLSAENWNSPFVVTTNVQLFESIFAARPSRCRKMHNIVNSVIVLDEFQAFPDEYLRPALLALEVLVKHFRCTVVFCTATQPALECILPLSSKVKEIVEPVAPLFSVLRRVTLHRLGDRSDEDISNRMSDCRQALCVVNTRSHARTLATMSQADPDSFHLSALMCPMHRVKTLDQIRSRLATGSECRVISTQLIEAGVDMDFPVVFRASTGLDSIIQAAGRCNREGKRSAEDSPVYLFQPENQALRGWFKRVEEITHMVEQNCEDLLSPEAIRQYYELRYVIFGSKGELDKLCILDRIQVGYRELLFPFRTIGEEFQLIDDFSRTIVIPYDETARGLIRQAKKMPHVGFLSRKLQPYVVSVPPYLFDAYVKVGWLECVQDTIWHLVKERGYDLRYGLMPVNDEMKVMIV